MMSDYQICPSRRPWSARYSVVRLLKSAVVGVVAGLSLSGPALASRLVTGPERSVILRASGFRIPGPRANYTLKVRVSTVSPRWAAVYNTPKPHADVQQSFELLKRTNDHWQVFNPAGGDPCGAAAAAPRAVVRDLKVGCG